MLIYAGGACRNWVNSRYICLPLLERLQPLYFRYYDNRYPKGKEYVICDWEGTLGKGGGGWGRGQACVDLQLHGFVYST